MPERTIPDAATVRATSDQVSADLSGEVAILHLSKGTYYGLDEVGARIWSLLQQPTTPAAVVATLLTEYEVEAEQCRRDLQALLRSLLAEGLIEVND